MSRLNFHLEATATGSKARAGTFRTLHNEVRTPLFMPVGTQATVKAQLTPMLEDAGSQILLANTYHLLLRPGPEVFRKFGGIHSFMNWKKSVLTDSGGYQIFSLPHSRRMTEDGATFQSYVDGRKILLSPELSIDTQRAIGSDIMMVLDQCVPSTSDRAIAREAMELTHRWARRSLVARGESPQSLFGIVQGACFEDLRRESASRLTELPFDGFAIGGLAVGESKELREDFTELSAELLPRDLPRYLMGVGTPIDLLEAVHRGVDMFDCILPGSLAQGGVAYTSRARMELRRGVYKFSDDRLDPDCACMTCRDYSRGYLHHLVKTKEMLGWQLLGLHNITFYHRLMREIRESILDDTFAALYREKRVTLQRSDEDHPKHFPKPARKRKGPLQELGRYEVVVSADGGFSSIRERTSGEIMHSVSEPYAEACRLYVEQPRLKERLLAPGNAPLVVWDVGLGAGANAMAVIRAYEEYASSLENGEVPRSLELISFENDLDSFRLAIKNRARFTYLWHAAPEALLQENHWTAENVGLPLHWWLVQGDFLQTMTEAAIPDLILHDPFSWKTDHALWTPDCFRAMRAHCQEHPTELYTYSSSTAVRGALLAAGFHVAQGVGTGPRAETTVAMTPAAARLYSAQPTREWLDGNWLQRWERSGARVPESVQTSHASEFEARVRGHEQFQDRT